jgi:hypothetical protein
MACARGEDAMAARIYVKVGNQVLRRISSHSAAIGLPVLPEFIVASNYTSDSVKRHSPTSLLSHQLPFLTCPSTRFPSRPTMHVSRKRPYAAPDSLMTHLPPYL